jgi:hypothetical protein|tara:strand:- start:527 stop:976 length:450 start_codon:yes stop_codon:yes gene_type:complete
MKKLIVVLITTLFSCSSVKENQVLKTPDKLKIEFSRGACYGTCPIYTISVNEDRHVKYNGKRFVEAQGIFDWYMDRLDFKELDKLLSRKELSVSVDYNLRAQDLPLTSLTIYTETDTITIKHKGAIPKELKESIKELEFLLTKSANWGK